jgi:hypothetical protein
VIIVSLPLRIVSEANARDHWTKSAKRAREQRGVTAFALRPKLTSAVVKPQRMTVVTLTRQGPRSLDSDNLQRALKAVRDGVADALGMDDADPRIEWRYGQERSKTYGVMVVIE